MRPHLQDNKLKELFTSQREDDSSESDVDDEYKIFLDHVKEDGYSYIFEMSSVHVKYEKDEPFSENTTETNGDSEIEPIQRRYVACKAKLKNSKPEREIFPSNTFKYRKLRKHATDPCYRVFLRHVRVRGDSLFFKLGDSVTVKYGQEIESPNASIMTEATPFPAEELQLHGSSSIPSDMPMPMFEDGSTFTGTYKTSKISYFEKGLKSLCDKPFDQDEYEHLLHEVTTCKPMGRDKHLRGGVVKSYQTKNMGKSYFDHHPDFAERIRTACCLKHCLKQLRGFMFWMENLCHEEAFRPWKDEQFNLCDNC